jgi:hypothetical protein
VEVESLSAEGEFEAAADGDGQSGVAECLLVGLVEEVIERGVGGKV